MSTFLLIGYVMNIKIKLMRIVPKKFSISCKKILYETHLSWDRVDGGQLVNPARPKTLYVKLDKYWWQTYTCSGSRSWSHPRKFFTRSTEFYKNISYWRHNCIDYKNDLNFSLRLVKWPKIAVQKSQIFQKF